MQLMKLRRDGIMLKVPPAPYAAPRDVGCVGATVESISTGNHPKGPRQ